MEKLKISVDFKIEKRDILHVILYLLYERKSNFNITKESIIGNLKSWLKTIGYECVHSKNFIKPYKNDDNFEAKKKNSENIFYDLFPEMVEEANSLHFIKSIGS